MFAFKKTGAMLLSGVLAATMVLSFTGCNEGDSKTIAVEAKGKTHAFWQSEKKGAEDAGK